MPEVPRHECPAAVEWLRGADVEEELSVRRGRLPSARGRVVTLAVRLASRRDPRARILRAAADLPTFD